MSGLEVLRRVREAGGDIHLKHGKLVLVGASRTSAALVAEAREHRAAILATLLEYAAAPEFSDALKAADAALEATERAAIIAEGEHGDARASVPHRLPPSWADIRIEPTPGAACHCCKGGRWWCETINPSGWRCMTCHPPAHLSAGQYRET